MRRKIKKTRTKNVRSPVEFPRERIRVFHSFPWNLGWHFEVAGHERRAAQVAKWAVKQPGRFSGGVAVARPSWLNDAGSQNSSTPVSPISPRPCGAWRQLFGSGKPDRGNWGSSLGASSVWRRGGVSVGASGVSSVLKSKTKIACFLVY